MKNILKDITIKTLDIFIIMFIMLLITSYYRYNIKISFVFKISLIIIGGSKMHYKLLIKYWNKKELQGLKLKRAVTLIRQMEMWNNEI